MSTFEQVGGALVELLRGRMLVAHNLLFDAGSPLINHAGRLQGAYVSHRDTLLCQLTGDVTALAAGGVEPACDGIFDTDAELDEFHTWLRAAPSAIRSRIAVWRRGWTAIRSRIAVWQYAGSRDLAVQDRKTRERVRGADVEHEARCR